MNSFSSSLEETNHFEFPIGEGSNSGLIKADLLQINHLLISGATGSGKSVFTDSALLTLMAHNPPEKLRLILCDTKIAQFSQYGSTGHLLAPVCTASEDISFVFQWALLEGKRRLRTFAEANVTNIAAYNDLEWEKFHSEIPHIIVVIDDLSAVVSSSENAASIIMQLLSIGRSVGIHIFAITQTPSVRQTKSIASLFFSKITFQAAPADLRFITGKRKLNPLIQPGDAWYCSAMPPVLVHTLYPTGTDARSILEAAVRNNPFSSEIMNGLIQVKEKKYGYNTAALSVADDSVSDELLPAAVEVVLKTGQASAAIIQRRLKLGYSRAARLVDQMEERGYVGPFEGSKPRKILITRTQWQKIREDVVRSINRG